MAKCTRCGLPFGVTERADGSFYAGHWCGGLGNLPTWASQDCLSAAEAEAQIPLDGHFPDDFQLPEGFVK